MTTSPRQERAPGPEEPLPAASHTLGRTVALVVILSVFWLLVSGKIGLQYFLFMAAAVGLVVWMNPERPFRRMPGAADTGIGGRLRSVVALFRYLVWLVWNVIVANIDVARRILSPSMPIRPRLMAFRVEMESEVARALVANSITLTPGTVTIDVDDHLFLVHALHPDASGAVTSGGLQNAVAPVFAEGPQRAPEIRWGNGPDDVLPGDSDVLPLTPEEVAVRQADGAPEAEEGP